MGRRASSASLWMMLNGGRVVDTSRVGILFRRTLSGWTDGLAEISCRPSWANKNVSTWYGSSLDNKTGWWLESSTVEKCVGNWWRSCMWVSSVPLWWDRTNCVRSSKVVITVMALYLSNQTWSTVSVFGLPGARKVLWNWSKSSGRPWGYKGWSIWHTSSIQLDLSRRETSTVLFFTIFWPLMGVYGDNRDSRHNCS